MPLVTRRVLAAALSLACAGAVVACSASAGSAPEVVDIANSTAESAENGLDQLEPEAALATVVGALRAGGAFHVTGTMLNGGEIDLRYVVGEGAAGTVVDPDGGAPVEILAVDGQIYVTGDEDFLAESVGEDVDQTVAGKWLRLPDESTAAFDVIADGQQFLETVLSGGEDVKMTGVRELDGAPVIGLRVGETTLWVAASGEPLPIRLEEKGASADAGMMWFEPVDEEVALEAPDSEDVLDAEELGATEDAGEADDG